MAGYGLLSLIMAYYCLLWLITAYYDDLLWLNIADYSVLYLICFVYCIFLIKVTQDKKAMLGMK